MILSSLRSRSLFAAATSLLLLACTEKSDFAPRAVLIPTEKFKFNSFVDCNMAEVWVGDTLRIFPGKYGEDPLWGYAHDLKFASGSHADEVFSRRPEEFTEPVLPPNTAPGTPGLHGAIWFETVYQSDTDASGRTLYAVYHNENYPATLPYDAATGKGYIDKKWPQGLTGPTTPASVCRIGIMKSTDGGRSWDNRGIFLEDLQPRMILKPHNNTLGFAGGVGDPSAVRSGDYLYLFYGEYGYPGVYDSATYSRDTEWSGQCISVARVAIADLDAPEGKARRWDGTGFNAAHDGIGQPITAVRVPKEEGGGAASSKEGFFQWGPSVSWNSYLNAWVMLMARAEGPWWHGGKIYISYNPHKDLGAGDNSQQWTKPVLLLDMPDRVLWYPSLQPTNSPDDVREKRTSVNLGQEARLFFKDQHDTVAEYYSAYRVKFLKAGDKE